MSNEIKSSAAGIKSVKFNGYKVDMFTNRSEKPAARLSKLLTSGKNKGQYKALEAYYFASEERRIEWIGEKMNRAKTREAAKADEKKALLSARENMVIPHKVGDVLYDSWGYDQTNVDFYQVIEVKAKSIVMQRIEGTFVDGTAGHDSCNVKPVLNAFCGKPELKPVGVRVYNGAVSYHLSSKYGALSLYDRGDRGVYSSWGH